MPTTTNHSTALTNSLHRSYRMQARATQPASPEQQVQHGLYRVRSQSGGEPHSVCLVWFGTSNMPVIVCDCASGTFRKLPDGTSVCTHSTVVQKRLLRSVNEALPPVER